MGRQFRFYLLPSDIERMAEDLRVRFGARFLDATSPAMIPAECESLVRTFGTNTASIDCYFTMPGSEIKTRYNSARKLWFVDLEPEVIEFSGCYFHGDVLQPGRFYFQTDFVMGNELWKKRPEFLKWADRVFRETKKLLEYSSGMMAYVGGDAKRWRQSGGRFASLRRADGTCLYETEW